MAASGSGLSASRNRMLMACSLRRGVCQSAVTDSGTEVLRAPDKAGISNLIEIMAAVRGTAPADVEAS